MSASENKSPIKIAVFPYHSGKQKKQTGQAVSNIYTVNKVLSGGYMRLRVRLFFIVIYQAGNMSAKILR